MMKGLSLLLCVSTIGCMVSGQNYVPLSFGPGFENPIGPSDIMRGFKINIAAGESAKKAHVFDGTIKSIPFTSTYGKSVIVKSDSDVGELLDIQGSLKVSYGPMISGEGAGRFLQTKVTSKRSATIVYRSLISAYAKKVDVSTLTPAEGTNLNNKKTDEITDIYGTKFIDQIIYGAQLDITFEVVSSEEIDVQSIEAQLKGKVGVGPLSVEFSARFEQETSEAMAELQMSIKAQASGVTLTIPSNPSFDEVNNIITQFNGAYKDLIQNLKTEDDLENEANVLNQMTPIGFTVTSIADHFSALDKVELALLDEKMEYLGTVLESAYFWRSKLTREHDLWLLAYENKPRGRDEILLPYSNQVKIALSVLSDKITECLEYRRLPLSQIVGTDGSEPATRPEMYPNNPSELKILHGLTGQIFLPSPVTIGATSFPNYHYIGFALPKGDAITAITFTPWLSGKLRQDSDNLVIATSETTPDVLERDGFAFMNGIDKPSAELNYIKYGGQGYNLQVNNIDNAWLFGGRWDHGRTVSTNAGVHNALASQTESVDMIASYKWFFRSTMFPLDEKLDVKSGECVRYGDQVYLQNNFNALSDTAAHQLLTEFPPNAFGRVTDPIADPSVVDWIVRSTPGNGERSDRDPAHGECVQSLANIYFQNNSGDRVWLVGARGLHHAYVGTRNNYLEEQHSEWHRNCYKWTVRETLGYGLRDDGFHCGVRGNSIHGKWVPLQFNEPSSGSQSVKFVEGIVDRDTTEPWTNNNSWKDSIIGTIQRGFAFGAYGEDSGWLPGVLISPSVRESISSNEVNQTIQLPTGQVWQFIMEMGDSCDSSWELRTRILDITPSINEKPCCLPGMEVDDIHGPCAYSSPCQCEDVVCVPPVNDFYLPETSEKPSDESGQSGGFDIALSFPLFALSMTVIGTFVI